MKTFSILAMLLFLVAAVFFWQTQVPNKQVNIVNPPAAMAVPKSNKITAEGRIGTYPGAEITVSADFGGILQNLTVQEGDTVNEGQIIAQVHAEDLQAALAQAKIRAQENYADIKLADAEFVRFRNLWAKGSSSKQEFDKVERNLNAAKAHYATDVAEIHRLQTLLNKAQVSAPISGTVIERYMDAGEAVHVGTALVKIVDLTQRRVEAEVDEFDVGKVSLNAPVHITAEGFTQSWTGKIEEIPAYVGSRKIKPQDPASPVDTRVLMVKISVDNKNLPLKLGQRVSVNIGR